MKEIIIHYKISLSDYIRINIWAALERNIVWKLIYRYGFYLMDAFILVFAILSEMSYKTYILVGLMALFPFLLRQSVVRKAKKTYRENAVLKEHTITITVNDKGIEEQLANHRFMNEWETMKQAIEIKGFLIFVVEHSRILFIAKDQLPEAELNLLREFIHAKLPSHKNKKVNH